MASVYRKVCNLFSNPSMQAAYAAWAFAKVRGVPPVVALPGGSQVRATDRFNDYYSIWLQHPGEDEFATYRELLADDGVYVDVGANMGLLCALAAKAAKLDRIIAFEPTHAYAAVWHENMARNRIENAALFQCAVSDRSGSFEFIVNPRAPLHNRLNLGTARNRYQTFVGDQTRTEKVPAITLDGVAEMLALKTIHLLKVDVEGAEPFVLRGAQNLLKRAAIRSMIIEFIPEFMREMGVKPLDFVNYVHSFGYSFHRIRKEGGVGQSMSTDNLVKRDFEGLNLIVLPPKECRVTLA